MQSLVSDFLCRGSVRLPHELQKSHMLAYLLRAHRQTEQRASDQKIRRGMLVQAAVRADFVGADITMAVPNMLEILPQGINKWVGMQLLLQDLKVCVCLPRRSYCEAWAERYFSRGRQAYKKDWN